MKLRGLIRRGVQQGHLVVGTGLDGVRDEVHAGRLHVDVEHDAQFARQGFRLGERRHPQRLRVGGVASQERQVLDLRIGQGADIRIDAGRPGQALVVHEHEGLVLRQADVDFREICAQPGRLADRREGVLRKAGVGAAMGRDVHAGRGRREEQVVDLVRCFGQVARVLSVAPASSAPARGEQQGEEAQQDGVSDRAHARNGDGARFFRKIFSGRCLKFPFSMHVADSTARSCLHHVFSRNGYPREAKAEWKGRRSRSDTPSWTVRQIRAQPALVLFIPVIQVN